MRKEIKEKITYHKNDLLAKWSAQKEVLDYQALKEFRTDLEMTHRALRNMVNDWDRRKISDLLSDHPGLGPINMRTAVTILFCVLNIKCGYTTWKKQEDFLRKTGNFY